MTSRRLLLAILGALAGLASTPVATHALPILVELVAVAPTALPLYPSEPIVLELRVSSLVAAGAPSLGAYEIKVAYNEAALDFVSASFGTGLGAPLSFQGLFASAGQVELGEASLLTVGQLVSLQPDAFVLATLHFTAQAVGEAQFSLSQVLLGDESGFSFAPSDIITQVPSLTIVPEPATALCILAGLGILSGTRRAVRGADPTTPMPTS